MNKTKRVAWRKHRIAAKKAELKRKAQKASGAAGTSATTARR